MESHREKENLICCGQLLPVVPLAVHAPNHEVQDFGTELSSTTFL